MRYEHADLVVVGGGIIGSLVAWRAAVRGLSVALVEQYRPGHAAGSSHGASRVLSRCLPDLAAARLAGLCLPRWRELEDLAGEKLVHPSPTLDICQDVQALGERLRCLEETAAPFELLPTGKLRRRFPEFSLPDGAAALCVEDGALLAADPSLAAAWKVCRRCDVSLFVDARIEILDLEYDRPTAVSSDVAYRGRGLVVAAGAWTGQLLGDLAVRVHRQQYVLYEPRAPQRFRAGEFPAFVLEAEGELFRGHPAPEGGGMRVGRRDDQPAVPAEHAPEPSRKEQARVDELLGRYLPLARGRALSGTTALTTASADGRFLLGPHPQRDDVVVAAGFDEHGFGLAPGLAEVVVDLASRTEPTVPVLDYLPGRSSRVP